VDIYVVDCTFYGNIAFGGGGGVGGNGDAFTGTHVGGNGGAGGSAYGGAISFSVGCPVPNVCPGLIHNTISQNTASVGPGGLGGHGTLGFVDGSRGVNGSGNGGGMHHVNGVGSIDVGNTIVASNFVSFRTTFGAAILNGLDVYGDYVSHSYNLIGTIDGNTSGWFAATDLLGTAALPMDARLGIFQDNGGETKTMAPLACSPAIDAGTTQSVNRDQIRQKRPVIVKLANFFGDGSDIGAYELTNYPAIGELLSIARTGNNVVVSWPSSLDCFQLQYRTNLIVGTWAPVTNAVTMVGSTEQVTLPGSAGTYFFRLFQP
jgi:hypothetical protein